MSYYTWEKSTTRSDQWTFSSPRKHNDPVVELTRKAGKTRTEDEWRARYLDPRCGPLDDMRTPGAPVAFGAVKALQVMSHHSYDDRGKKICKLALARLGYKFGMGQSDEVGT